MNYSRTNPVSHDFVLMHPNVNLLNRVPEYDYPTFFVLHRTKCKQMDSEWEPFSDISVLHRTKCKLGMHRIFGPRKWSKKAEQNTPNNLIFDKKNTNKICFTHSFKGTLFLHSCYKVCWNVRKLQY